MLSAFHVFSDLSCRPIFRLLVAYSAASRPFATMSLGRRPRRGRRGPMAACQCRPRQGSEQQKTVATSAIPVRKQDRTESLYMRSCIELLGQRRRPSASSARCARQPAYAGDEAEPLWGAPSATDWTCRSDSCSGEAGHGRIEISDSAFRPRPARRLPGARSFASDVPLLSFC